MKKEFPGYYLPSDEEFNEIWKNCDFLFDANVLLNLYRYTKETRKALIDIFESVEDRIWIPHQAALEYHRNRINVIEEHLNAYKKVKEILSKKLNEIKSLLTQIYQNGRHPLLNCDNFINKLTILIEEHTSEVDELKEIHPDLIYDDPIKDKLTKLFEGRVCDQLDQEETENIIKIGEDRYKKEIPPGYMDEKKESPECFGDLILWFQIIKHAKKRNRAIIFVTDDRKKDWWYRPFIKTIGPRPELISEIEFEASVKFYMYSADPFMLWAKKYLDQKVDEQAINEVKIIRKYDEEQAGYISRIIQGQEELVKNITPSDISRIAQAQNEMMSALVKNITPLDFSRIAQAQNEMMSALVKNITPSDFSRIVQAQNEMMSALGKNITPPDFSRLVQALNDSMRIDNSTTQSLENSEGNNSSKKNSSSVDEKSDQ